ncbi:MAG: flagellar hook-associated protein FlgL [Oscillospiraceae bacterium]|nr:flagellar hook-associated protein FlgL [Oscillospiraceae bacterium]
MRVTQGMMTNSFLHDLFKTNDKFQLLGKQLSSRRRITRPSDDSIGTTRSLRVRGDVSELKQFSKNVDDAKSYLNTVESSLSQIETMYIRLIEIAEGCLNGAMEDTDLKSYSEEAKQLQDELVNVANSSYAGKFIFGGFNTTNAPFKLDDNGNLMYNGIDIINDAGSLNPSDTEVLSYQLADSILFELGFSGVDLMGTGDENLYKILTDFTTELEAGNFENAGQFVGKFKDSQNHILSLESEIGAKQNRLDYMSERYADDSLTLEDRRMNIEDIDMAETISDLKYAQVVYQATLQANAMILQPSLLNYL